MPLKLSIIIVNYNVKAFLQHALESIEKACMNLLTEIIVVDNNSTDGSQEMVESVFPRVQLIRNEENEGFSKANNRALKIVQGEYIIMLNPDTVVQEDTFTVMANFMDEHTDASAVGCKVLNADGTLQLACRRSFPTPLVALPRILGLDRLFPKSRLFGKYNLTYLDEDVTTEVDAISGSCMMVRKSIIEKIGYLDEDFFMYGEDLDWFYRMKKAGYKIYYAPDTKIIHYKGESSRRAGIDTIALFYKAQAKFVRKHFSASRSALLLPLLYIGIVLRAAISYTARFSVTAAPAVVDLFALQISLILALSIKFGSLVYFRDYLLVDSIYSVVWLLSLYLLGLYHKRRFSVSFAAIAVFTGFLINTTFTFFFKQFAYSREVLLWLLLFNVIFLSGWRIFLRIARRFSLFPFLGGVGKTILSRRTLIVGTGSDALLIAKKLRESFNKGYQIIGFIGKNLDLDSADAPPVLGKIENIEEIARINRITDIIFSTDALSYEEILGIVDSVSKTKLNYKIVPKSMEFIVGKASVDTIDDFPLIDLDYNIDKLANRLVKRTFDLVASAIVFPVFILPVALYAGFKGLALKKRKIKGSEDETIDCRVLVSDGRDVPAVISKFPLLISVLRGDLSLVGSDIIPDEQNVPAPHCKPGLTGLARIVSPNSNANSERDRYEHYYLRNQSLRLDVEILLKSLFNI